MEYLNLAFREQTLFELYKSKSKSEVEEILKLALMKINDEILKTNGKFTKKRLNVLFAKIAAEISPAYNALLEKLPNESAEIAE